MSTRADQYTQLKQTPIQYTDFFDKFFAHPVTGDVATIKNADSIKQSLKNLIYTNYGERFFQPGIGSNVYKSLFEPNDQFVQEDLQYHIRETIEQNEPRVNLIQVYVKSDFDTDQIAVNIVFSIINTSAVQNLNMILQRVR
jgi:phage baseplate assembly protein W